MMIISSKCLVYVDEADTHTQLSHVTDDNKMENLIFAHIRSLSLAPQHLVDV